jgi:hypothetical protein
MCKATIDLVSPSGVPVTLEVSNTDDQQTLIGLLERAEKIGVFFGNRSWSFAHAEATGPSAGELAQGTPLPAICAAPPWTSAGCPRGSSWTASRRSGARSRATPGTACARATAPTHRCCAYQKASEYRKSKDCRCYRIGGQWTLPCVRQPDSRLCSRSLLPVSGVCRQTRRKASEATLSALRQTSCKF